MGTIALAWLTRRITGMRAQFARSKGRSCRPMALRREHGLVFLPLLAILMLGALYSLTSRFSEAVSPAPHARAARTVETLNRAKAALIAFAAENVNRPGGLPCPDRDGDGESEMSCDRAEQRIGFFPWQTLKTGDLRDGSGSRLWYAVSKSFRNDPDVAINSHTRGELELAQRRADGSRHTLARELIAVVIGPGEPILPQHRLGAGLTARDAWLEGSNASGTPGTFEIEERAANGNDAIAGLAHAELFDVVDRVVASRLRTEIVPLLREQVYEPWQSLPFAVPFEAPARSKYQDLAKRDSLEGLLPVTHDAEWVHWDRSSIDASTSGSGVVHRFNCSPSTIAELRCDIDYSGAATIRITALARNVGRALVRPLSVEESDLGPDSLIGRRIAHGAVTKSGDALIEATATLPPTRSSVRVTLRTPPPIQILTDPRVPVATKFSWFARNRWHELLYYAISPNTAPGSSSGHCGVSACLATENRHGERSQAGAALIFMGRALSPRAGEWPDSLASYLEGDNALPGDRSFADGVPSATFNDALVVLCTSSGDRCK